MVISSSENKLRLMDLLEILQKDLTTPPKKLETVKLDHIVRVLEQAHWKMSGKNGTPEILGLNPSTLRAACENSAFASHSSSIHMSPPKTVAATTEMLRIRHM